jgi:hypothetical protein
MKFSYQIPLDLSELLQDVTNFINLLRLISGGSEQKRRKPVYTTKRSKLRMNKYI